jgi:polar amino acid transport system substrate-binding protein
MKKFGLLFVLSLVTVTLLSACGMREIETNSWPRIEKTKKVIIGLDDTFVPMGYQDKAGNIIGFDVDLAKAVFKEYGVTVDFQAIDWNMKETELKNQTIDLIWNGYTRNAEREKTVLFSDTYMKNDQVLVSLKKENITKFSDMKGKILGMQQGSSGADVFENEPKVLKQYIKDDPVLYSSFNEGLLDLKAGRIDALLIDKVYAGYYLEQEGDLSKYNITRGGFESEDFSIGARKSDKELISKINQALKKLVKNGEFKKISEKWFGSDVTPDDLKN